MCHELSCDVVILGTGLAGLTLARQLHDAAPHLRIALLGKAEFPLPDFTSKVGESTVDVGAFYLKEVVRLREELDENHLEKMGLRFLQTGPGVADYRESGIDDFACQKCYQINRGGLENSLYESLKDKVTFHMAAHIRDIRSQPFHHEIGFRKGQQDYRISAPWLVDASGRGRVLARHFGLHVDSPLTHSAVWFRVDGQIDLNELYQDDEEGRFCHPYRYRSTTHVMGKGYWAWLIPLKGGVTSVGIVFDETTHDPKNIMQQDRALAWLAEHEPALCQHVRRHSMLDFKMLRKYSFRSERLYSPDGWFLTGEAAGFVDPLYSNGTDFIGVGNTIITRMITEDHENFKEKIDVYNDFMQEIYDVFTQTHLGSYEKFDDWYYIYAKTNWDTLFYFLFLCALFMNRKIEDYDFLCDHLVRAREVCRKHVEVCNFLRSDAFNTQGYETGRFGNMRGTVEDDVYRFLMGRDDNDYREIFRLNCDYIMYLGDRILAGDDVNEVFHDRHDFYEQRSRYETCFVD